MKGRESIGIPVSRPERYNKAENVEAFAELTDVYEIETDFTAKVQSEFNK